jgi:hypothetical protein
VITGQALTQTITVAITPQAFRTVVTASVFRTAAITALTTGLAAIAERLLMLATGSIKKMCMDNLTRHTSQTACTEQEEKQLLSEQKNRSLGAMTKNYELSPKYFSQMLSLATVHLLELTMQPWSINGSLKKAAMDDLNSKISTVV